MLSLSLGWKAWALFKFTLHNILEIFLQGSGKRLVILGTHQDMELRPGVDSGDHFPKTPGTTEGFRVIPLQHKKCPLQFPYVVPKHSLPPAELAVGRLVLVVGEDVEPKNSRGRLPRVIILQCRHHIKELVSPGMRHKGSGLINMTTAGGISLGQPTVRLSQVNGRWLQEPVADIGSP